MGQVVLLLLNCCVCLIRETLDYYFNGVLVRQILNTELPRYGLTNVVWSSRLLLFASIFRFLHLSALPFLLPRSVCKLFLQLCLKRAAGWGVGPAQADPVHPPHPLPKEIVSQVPPPQTTSSLPILQPVPLSRGGFGMEPITSVSQGGPGMGPIASVSQVGSRMGPESGVSRGVSGMEPLGNVSLGGSGTGPPSSVAQGHEYQATLAAAPVDNYQGQFDSQTRSQSSFQTNYSHYQHPQTMPSDARDIPAQSHHPVSSLYHPVSSPYQPRPVPQLLGVSSSSIFLALSLSLYIYIYYYSATIYWYTVNSDNFA